MKNQTYETTKKKEKMSVVFRNGKNVHCRIWMDLCRSESLETKKKQMNVLNGIFHIRHDTYLIYVIRASMTEDEESNLRDYV